MLEQALSAGICGVNTLFLGPLLLLVLLILRGMRANAGIISVSNPLKTMGLRYLQPMAIS